MSELLTQYGCELQLTAIMVLLVGIILLGHKA